MIYKAKYIFKSLVFFFTLSVSVNFVFAQIPDTPQDEMLPEADPLKVDRFNVEFLIAEGMHFIAIENNAKALNSFLKAHQIMPNNDAVNYKIAEIYLETEVLDQALLYIDMATQAKKDNYYYLALQANIQTQLGDLPAAIESYEAIYQYNEDAPDDYLLELAALYIYNGQPNQAFKTYNLLEKRVGIIEEVSNQKQKILLKLNKLDEAILEGKKLAEAYPKVGAYANAVAQILISNDRKEEAVGYLNDYLAKHPNQVEAHMELAKIYRQNNENDLALFHFQIAFESEEVELEEKLNNFVAMIRLPKNEQFTQDLKDLGGLLLKFHQEDANVLAANGDLYFSLDQKDSALYFYQLAIQKEGDNLQLWQNILALEMENQSYQQVAKYAEEAITFFPNQPVLYLYAGSAYFSLKKYTEAIMQWEQGKAIVFGNNQLKSTFAAQLGDAYHANKEYKKSFNAYEEAIAANPDNYFAINNYTYYLSLKKQDLERAKKLSARMVKANPENSTFLDTHGWVLFQMEEYSEALKFLKKASELQASGTIIEHYGDVLYKTGKVEEAIKQWQRAKEKGGVSKTIEKKITDKKYYEDSI